MSMGRTPIINDDGTCTTGTVIDNAWKQEFYDQIDVALGKWYPITFNAANFLAPGATWTVTAGNVGTNRAALAGNTLLWNIIIDASAIAGAPTPNLSLVIPYGLFALGSSQGVATAYDGGAAWFFCNVSTTAGNNQITISKLDFSSFPANSATYLRFKTWIDVNV